MCFLDVSGSHSMPSLRFLGQAWDVPGSPWDPCGDPGGTPRGSWAGVREALGDPQKHLGIAGWSPGTFLGVTRSVWKSHRLLLKSLKPLIPRNMLQTNGDFTFG